MRRSGIGHPGRTTRPISGLRPAPSRRLLHGFPRTVVTWVYDAYSAYWRLIKERAFTDVQLATTDAVKPSSALIASPAPTTAGWHRDDVALRIAASDGHGPGLSSGLARLRIELSGAQNSSAVVVPPDPRLPPVAEILVSAEGTTTVTYSTVDNAGNSEVARTAVIRIDTGRLHPLVLPGASRETANSGLRTVECCPSAPSRRRTPCPG